MKRPHHAPDEKVRIIMESINTHITPAKLCRKHNINPASITRWRDIFFECGKAGIKKPYNRNESKKHDHEMDKLKRIIGDLTIANDALKKTLEWSTK